MYISKHELVAVQVYLRAILQHAKANDYGELAYLVDMIEDDLNIHRAAKDLLFSFIDESIKI